MPVLPGMDFNEYRIGKRGSADEMGIEFEATLRVLNPKSHFYINGFTA
jgi:hypothetical protein